jgi:CDP-glucose 4,6-dehydratase
MTVTTSQFWRGRRVFLTGHTGFKGAWLRLLLEELGAHVEGASLPPATSPSLHGLLHGAAGPRDIQDIREAEALARRIQTAEPEIVMHLAAQPLVRASYREPALTYETNVLGTVNVLEALRGAPSVRAAVIVTTDKVYENNGDGRPFVETDRLGGHDPYSNSKACAELAAQCYRDSYFSRPGAAAIATVRAGNVVGGGDWSQDRLVPDIVRAIAAGETVELRYPRAVRPWQHVLEPLRGYMRLAEALVADPAQAPHALNFGPDPEGALTVAEVVDRFGAALGAGGWRQAAGEHPPEASVLTLATGLAKRSLGWRPLLDVDATVDWTAAWYRSWLDGADMRAATLGQIRTYLAMAAAE